MRRYRSAQHEMGGGHKHGPDDRCVKVLQEQLFRNFFVYTKQDTDTLVVMYRLARSQSEELAELIAAELSE